MMSKNKKVIYAVVGIMVLFIMIVGSTVAYLTLSEKDIDTITGNMADVDFDLSVTKVTDADDTVGLIPMSNNMVEKALSNNNVCLDEKGNAVCQVYKIKINNTSNVNMLVDGYITLSGGSGEPVDYPNYQNTDEKSTMRWAQAFCSDEADGKVTKCTTAGSTTTRVVDNINFKALGGESVKNDGLNREEIKDKKDDVIQGGIINGNFYDVINKNYIRVSDHGIDDDVYNQDKDVTSALVYNQYLEKNDSDEGNNDGTSSSTFKDSQVYYFVVWLGENGQNQSTVNNKQFFSGKVLFTSAAGDRVTARFGDDTLYSMMKEASVPDNEESEFVTSSLGIDFGNNSSDENGKGVYQLNSTSKNPYPIYYYRGNVQDNNVKFANFCWKIVRTTETGGVKLIYNGSPDDSGGCTNTTGDETRLTETKFNSNSISPADVGYMYGTRYTYKSKSISSSNYTYGKTVSYEGDTYTLETTTSGAWSELYNGGLNSNHYTCFTENNTCSTVNYIFYTSSSYAYYIELTGGKKVEEALKEMTSESTNDHDSTIKEYIDSWYSEHMTEYTNFLEDTVWCNDRSIGELNGWNPDGGDTTDTLKFLPYTRVYTQKSPSLTCSNDNDKFTVDENNGNGELTYPVGLLTGDEVMYAGGTTTSNSSYYLYTNKDWWVLSPSFYSNTAYGLYVYANGTLNYGYFVNGTFDVRPSVSLRPGIRTIGGDGSQSAPFEIKSE